MKYVRRNFAVLLGLFITFFYLFLNIFLINDYGVIWDFTYHLNAGLWHLKLPLTDPSHIMGPSPPLSDILPTLSYLIFSQKTHFLPFDSAYNLYSVILGSLGIGFLYFFVKDLFNWQTAFFSSIFLALLPRYFGHLHNNMKDIPQAVFFTLALWLFWRFFQKPKFINLSFACLGFALSFNSKVNAIFVLLIATVYVFIYVILNETKNRNKLRDFSQPTKRFFQSCFQHCKRSKTPLIIVSYFIFAPLCAFFLWSLFWNNPIERLIEASHSYTTSTTNMPLLYFGRIFYSGNNVPWHYPFGVLAVTTPVIMLILFVVGLWVLLKMITKRNTDAWLLFLWFAIPISRYFKPQMIVIDDVRHFMEILFPFAVITGLGTWFIYDKLISKNRLLICIFFLFSIFYFPFSIIKYHPYQTSYYNEFIGGISGAKDKFDIDFWTASYKKALQYLNTTVKPDAKIIVAMAPDIAKLYLRSDLLPKLNPQNMTHVKSLVYSQNDYTVILNRQSFFQWYSIYPYIMERKPIYTLSLDGIPLTSIYKN